MKLFANFFVFILSLVVLAPLNAINTISSIGTNLGVSSETNSRNCSDGTGNSNGLGGGAAPSTDLINPSN